MRTLPLWFSIAASIGLAGCAQDDPLPEGPSTPISGVVAIGAPVAGAQITLRCQTGTFEATSSGQGAWQTRIPLGAPPCLIRASGGTPTVELYSYATTAGRINITPLTTLAVARAAAVEAGATDLAAYFGVAQPRELNAAVTRQGTALVPALRSAGYGVPPGFNIFTSVFTPVAGDAYDDLLEAFAEALARSGQSLADFQAAYVGGAAIPAAAADVQPSPSVQPTPAPTVQPTPTAGPTPTTQPTPTAEPTATPVITPTPTAQPTATPTAAPTPTLQPTATPQPTPTALPEAPANLAVLTAFAGIYTVTGTATDAVDDRGTATREHDRGTIIIGDDGSVYFDYGIDFTAGEINTLYDRRNICDFPPQANRAACRIHVNYDADDSGRRLELFLAPDQSTVTEIRYQDGQGGITRAAIAAAEEPEEPGGEGLGFTIHSMSENALVISFHGNLTAEAPTDPARALILHAPGNWITHDAPNSHQVESVIQTRLFGSASTYAVYAADGEHARADGQPARVLGDHLYIPGGAVQAGDAGSGAPVAIVFPRNVFVREAVESLSLYWGRQVSPEPAFEVLQSTAPVVWSEPAESTQVLGDSSGVTLLVDGVRHTTTSIESYTGAPLSLGTGYLTAGKAGDAFQANISGISSQVGMARACHQNGIPGVTITLDGVQYAGGPTQGGTCIVTTTALDEVRIHVAFEGLFKRTTESDTAPDYVQVVGGEFQYVVKTFAAGEGQPLVSASFEGADIRTVSQSNPLPLGADFGWKRPWHNVRLRDVSGNPLQVTPAGGSTLNGGSVAVDWLANHDLEAVFTGDVYVSFLVRWDTPRPGTGLLASRVATLANDAVYVGVVNGQFSASVGDDSSQKLVVDRQVVVGETYHIVGRLYKSAGSAHYDNLSLWVDPGFHDQNNPLGTASRSSSSTGSLRFVDKLGLSSIGRNNNPEPLADRIRLSDTWAGLFSEPVP